MNTNQSSLLKRDDYETICINLDKRDVYDPFDFKKAIDITYELSLVAVQKDGLALKYVSAEKQTPELCLAALKNNGLALYYVHNKTPEICLAAVKSGGNSIIFMDDKDITPELCLEAVKSTGSSLQYIKEPTYDMCLAAVKQWGLSIKYVPAEHRTTEVLLAAVTQHGDALRYIPAEQQTDEICLAAVSNYGPALRDVYNQTEEICLAAVKKDGRVLNYVKHQTLEICMAALDENFDEAYIFVDPEIKKQIDSNNLLSTLNPYIVVEKYESLPEDVDQADLDKLKPGNVYAFTRKWSRNGGWYLIGSLDELNRRIKEKISGSTKNWVYVDSDFFDGGVRMSPKNLRWVKV
jgi:hypothetical protein